MNDTLSHDEIDALLDMFRSEASDLDSGAGISLSTVREEEGPVVSPVDLLKPNRLGREQLLGLERYFESAAKLLSATISDKLRLETRCDCVGVEQVRFQTWLQHLPGPVAIYVVDMKPFQLPVLFTASTSLLYGAVDRILGGSGKVARVPKDFTSAEYTVADALIGPCLDRICESMRDAVPLEWSFQNRFCNPSMAQIIPSQDVVLSVYFQAAGSFLLGDLRMVIPFVAIEPYLDELSRSGASSLEPGTMRDVVSATVRDVPVEMLVQLGEAKIPLRQLLQLSEGDVVPVSTRIGQDLAAPVQGKTKFFGQIGTRGNRLAYRVTSVVN